MTTRTRGPTLAVRPLDDRVVPSSVLTYTDVDGDLVTVRTGPGLVAAAQFDAAHHQLQTLTLSANSAFAGTSVSITATPGPTGGDGLANVGYINATGIDLGAVTVHGDLGRIDAGTGGPTSVAVRSLTAVSMGRFGTTTQGAGPSLYSNLHGALGSLTVHGDLDAVSVVASGPNGKIGPVRVGGSLIGGQTSGEIRTAGALGPVAIGGDLVGGGLTFNGTDFPTGIVEAGGKLVGLTIGGSVIGAAFQGSGQVALGGDAGPIRVGGSLVGGSGIDSGSVFGTNPITVASLSVGGSLVPKSATTLSGTAEVVNGTIGWMTVGGDMGTFIAARNLGSVTIRGSIDDSAGPGVIQVYGGGAGAIRIGGSVTGALLGSRFGSVTVGGSVHGTIRADETIGRVTVRGSLVDSLVQAAGPAAADGKPSVAIGSVTVFGRVEHSQIRAGFDESGQGVNGDAQIGPVTVHGDWIASDLVAGINPGFSDVFGTSFDHPMTSGQPHSFSRIGPVVIGGQVLGTPGGGNSHGIEAQEVASLTVAGTKVRLTAGRSNDTTAIPLGATGDMVVREF